MASHSSGSNQSFSYTADGTLEKTSTFRGNTDTLESESFFHIANILEGEVDRVVNYKADGKTVKSNQAFTYTADGTLEKTSTFRGNGNLLESESFFHVGNILEGEVDRVVNYKTDGKTVKSSVSMWVFSSLKLP